MRHLLSAQLRLYSQPLSVLSVPVWLCGGIINLLEGYGNDNPGAKSQGMKQLMAGIALIAAGVLLVPVLGQMMNQAQSK